MNRYPEQIDAFIASLVKEAHQYTYTAETCGTTENLKPMYEELSASEGTVMRMTAEKMQRPFYFSISHNFGSHDHCMLYIPGYEGSLRSVPETEGTDWIFISPLGYGLADGSTDQSLRQGVTWPTLSNTITGAGYDDYRDFLVQILLCRRYIEEQLNYRGKYIPCGCSQGGGIALLLGSILPAERLAALCADEPFLVACSTKQFNDYLASVSFSPYQIFNEKECRRRLACIDPINHAEKIKVPVLVTAGTEDFQCERVYTELLYQKLQIHPKNAYILYEGRGHGYHSCFHRDMITFLKKHGIPG